MDGTCFEAFLVESPDSVILTLKSHSMYCSMHCHVDGSTVLPTKGLAQNQSSQRVHRTSSHCRGAGSKGRSAETLFRLHCAIEHRTKPRRGISTSRGNQPSVESLSENFKPGE